MYDHKVHTYPVPDLTLFIMIMLSNSFNQSKYIPM